MIAHPAGALGRTVWLLLSLACDWREVLERLAEELKPPGSASIREATADNPGIRNENPGPAGCREEPNRM
jgi:hypothetical protein